MKFVLYILVIGTALFAEEFHNGIVPDIPSGACSFDGDKLCPGIPGSIVQQNFQQGECAQSLNRLCSHVEPGEGRLAKCLRENSANLDSRCLTWGKRVGLDFQSAKPLIKPSSPASIDYYQYWIKPEKADPCAGSAWFTTPSCRVEKEDTNKAPTTITEEINPLLSPTSLDPITPPSPTETTSSEDMFKISY